MSGEINKNSVQVPVTPVANLSELLEGVQGTKQAVTPPEFKPKEISDSKKEAAQTTLPGSSTKDLSTGDIKSAVGEIVDNLDKESAWEDAANVFQERLAQQTKLDDETALDDPINVEWSLATGAEIAQFATA